MTENTIPLVMIGILAGVLLTVIALRLYSIISTHYIPIYYQGVMVGLVSGALTMAFVDRIDWSFYGDGE